MFELKTEEITYLESRYKELAGDSFPEFITSLQTELPNCLWVREDKISVSDLQKLIGIEKISKPLAWNRGT